MENSQKTNNDQSKYGPLSLWFLIELSQRVLFLLDAYGVRDEDGRRAGELILSICCLLDATSAEKFGRHVKPVLGFMDISTLKESPVTVLMPLRYSSIHDSVYNLLTVLREHPKFSLMKADDFSTDDLLEVERIVDGAWLRIVVITSDSQGRAAPAWKVQIPTQVQIPPLPRPTGVPGNWLTMPSDGPGGVVFYNPANSSQSVRVMPGDPASPYPNSQAPYVRQTDTGGNYLRPDGTRSPGPQGGKYDGQSHIPLGAYKFIE